MVELEQLVKVIHAQQHRREGMGILYLPKGHQKLGVNAQPRFSAALGQRAFGKSHDSIWSTKLFCFCSQRVTPMHSGSHLLLRYAMANMEAISSCSVARA